MNINELNTKLAELNAAAEALCIEYNEAKHDEKMSEMNKAAEKLDEIVSDYAKHASMKCTLECMAAEDGPMMEAVRRLTYPVIKAKETKDEVTTIEVMRVVTQDKPIDLAKLHKSCNGIGVDKDWIYAVEKFNMLMTARKCEELGIDPTSVNDSFAMSRIAKQYDLGKNPASKTNILKTMQSIVTMMIGDQYKPVSHDVNYILSIYAKKSNRKALTVSCANHKYMRQYMAEICHRLVTGGHYECEYKKVKA